MMNGLDTENLKLREDQKNSTKELKNATNWRSDWNDVRWFNVVLFIVTHAMSPYAIYLVFTRAMWSTIVFAYFLGVISNIGVTAGAHRLWSHRSYKVKFPLKILILLMYTLAFQGSVLQWVRDHRVHHKYSDTDADPHNSMRGFFFSHIGWLLWARHPEYTDKLRSIDTSDIENDPLLRMQYIHYHWLVFIITVIIPSCIPLLWNEDLWISFNIAVMLRYICALHMIFLINSAAHMWGYKPYDKDIYPAENEAVSFLASGEGFHNYHHTFPWDCKAAELGGYQLNISWLFINMMAKIGWAYDLKYVPEELIKKRAMRTGDGSHPVWGWNDKNLSMEYRQLVETSNKIK